MKQVTPNYKKYIFVCTNIRDEGEACCGTRGGEKLRDALKEKVAALGLGNQIRVSKTGCQGPCEVGPNIPIFPENIWYKGVEEKDLEEILKKHVLI